MRQFFASTTTKIVAIVSSLVAAVAVSSWIAYQAFGSVATSIVDIRDLRAKNLEMNLGVANEATEMAQILNAIFSAHDEAALDNIKATLDFEADEIAQMSSVLARNNWSGDVNLLTDALDLVAQLRDARQHRFAAENEIAESTTRLRIAGKSIGSKLQEVSSEANAQLVSGGEQTITDVNQTLEQLTGADFPKLLAMQQIRAEMNFLSTMTVALAEVSNPGTRSILLDLTQGSLTSLLGLIEDGEGFEFDPTLITDLNNYAMALGGLPTFSQTKLRSIGKRALEDRQTLDAVMASALDDLLFDVQIKSIDLLDNNEAAIRGLLQNQAQLVLAAAELDRTIGSYMQYALGILASDTVTSVNELASGLIKARASIGDLMETGNFGELMGSELSELIALSEPDTGLVALRLAVLNGQLFENEIEAQAAAKVKEIVAVSNAASELAFLQLSGDTAAVSQQITQAQTKMTAVLFVSIALGLAFLVVSYLVIIRPLNHAIRETERLASGNLDEITSVFGTSGEIKRQIAALKVFRDNIIEGNTLREKEEKLREEQRADKERRLREEKQREEVARQEAIDRDRERLEAERREQAEKDAMREAAEAERQEASKAQAMVVQSLANGLSALAAGDLSIQLNEAFPESYESLRQDFNAAMASLQETMTAIVENSSQIHLNINEISSGNDELARRTEQNAATLAQSAHSLSQLTASVTSAAETVSQVNVVAKSSESEARKSELVVSETVAAMAKIESSAAQISKIIDVIDDIAFQTNLLALNAGVEAARAGETGRGFAVVATEVRGLAQRSSEAANEIGQLIKASSTHVETGVTLVAKTGNALESLVTGMSEIATQIGQVAEMTDEQSHEITKINKAVESLDSATQENAAMFEESSAATHSLKGEADNLDELIRRFKTDEADTVEIAKAS